MIAVVAALWAAIALMPLADHYIGQTDKTAQNEQTATDSLSGNGRLGSLPQPPNRNRNGEAIQQPVGPGTWPDWAIVAFTLMLTVLGGLQYRLSRRTAYETKEALAIAKASADAASTLARAANDANALTKELFLTENRPNIVISHISVRHVHISDASEFNLILDVQLANNGRVLASRVAALSTHKVLQGFLPGGLFIPWMKEAATCGHRDLVSINIGMGETALVTPGFVLTADEFSRTQFGETFAVAVPTAIFYEFAAFKKGYVFAFDLMVQFNGSRDHLLTQRGEIDPALFTIQRMPGEARL